MSGTPSSDPQAGQPARRFRRPDTRAGHDPGGRWELIGPTECPIMWRLTIASTRWFKLLLHRFEPNASDKAPHDHPRSFVTFVLRGGYDDVRQCPVCSSLEREDCCGWAWAPVGALVDQVRAPAVRFRRAEHAHITKVGPNGATTIVVMGPLRREWGFFRDGRWYPWRVFERKFGLNWRCP